MAELITLARPYARAAFEAADQKENLLEWSAMLQVSKIVSEHELVQNYISNPALTATEKATLFIDVCDGRLNDQGKNFIGVLAENHRLTLIPEIVELFEQLKRQKDKTVDIELQSAFDVTEAQQQTLATVLSKMLGRTVNIEATTDKTLIGGVFIRAENQVIDASVRGKLKKLAETMNS